MKKILIVTGDAMQGIILEKVFGENYQVLEASSVKEAADMFEIEVPDLIFLVTTDSPDQSRDEFLELLGEKSVGMLSMMCTVFGTGKIDSYGFEVNDDACIDYIPFPCSANIILKRIETMLANIEYINSLKIELSLR